MSLSQKRNKKIFRNRRRALKQQATDTEKNKYRLYFWIALIAFSIIQATVLFILASRLPNKVPVHFNYNFEVDRWGSPFELLFVSIIPSLLFIIRLIVGNLYKQKPHNVKIEDHIIMTVGFFLITISWWLYSISLRPIETLKSESIRFLPSFIYLFLGVFAIILGNYEGTIKPNKTLGIKTKWTLEDDENWRKTHRFAGPLTIIGGFVFTICGILLLFLRRIYLYVFPPILFIILVGVIPTIYSYVLSRKMRN